ncbi:MULTISPECIES: hypothetical protein [unclassified Crossiella]|uniref:hypothetical protein n=1 Tax=unclassified Crossiella TaxID=2620835 RepID=UPI001FFF5D95|nr:MULTISPECIES: hypothetical protein [unclassified Crossiella]MCK2236445.1 hypothetical protein [Crossiella sp. S99.2]MCK2250112.1 hypothetical protein [Crossiella sp. S99.1]
MAERIPGWVDGIDAASARLTTGMTWTSSGDLPADPVGVRAGIRPAPGAPGQVSLNGDTVTVNAFQAVLPDPSGAGPFLVTVDGARRLTLTPPGRLMQRITWVLVQLTVDADGKPNGIELRLLDGPASDVEHPAVPPAPPPRAHLLLAELYLMDTAPVRVRDKRRFIAAVGGVLPVLDAADRPVSAPLGSYVHRLDTHVLEVATKDGWRTLDPTDTGWQAATPEPRWAHKTDRPLQVRRLGRMVSLSGTMTRTFPANAIRVAAYLPAEFSPGGQGHVWIAHGVLRPMGGEARFAALCLSAYRHPDGRTQLSLEESIDHVVEVWFDVTWSAD